MILSVSRRTDIPQYYSDWFFNRMKEGFLYVKNPMNSHQVSKIMLSPDLVDLVVFWTKNPAPMMRRIGELGEIPYYKMCIRDRKRIPQAVQHNAEKVDKGPEIPAPHFGKVL